MAMPRDLVMVRHGESEANVVQRMLRNDANAVLPEGFVNRHNVHMRLTERGVDQARAVGGWLLQNFPNGFDGHIVSNYVRARETAGELGIGGRWRIDDRWGERNWGEFSNLTEKERQQAYGISCRIRDQHEWYWCPPGGMSMAMTYAETKNNFGTLHREFDGKRLIVVTHGERIDTADADLRHIDPDTWLANRNNPERRLENAMALHYTRQDPETGELAGHMGWMRAICAWDPAKSWNSGDWIEIPPRPTYSAEELLAGVAMHERLLTPAV